MNRRRARLFHSHRIPYRNAHTHAATSDATSASLSTTPIEQQRHVHPPAMGFSASAASTCHLSSPNFDWTRKLYPSRDKRDPSGTFIPEYLPVRMPAPRLCARDERVSIASTGGEGVLDHVRQARTQIQLHPSAVRTTGRRQAHHFHMHSSHTADECGVMLQLTARQW